LWQKGKCNHCNTTISWQYPLVEITTALISALIVFIAGATIEALFYLVLSWFLVSLFMIDLKEHLLPDVLTIPLMWIGFIYQMQFGNLQDGVIGAMVGYLFLWGIYWLFKLLINKEGMGYGDFKLTAAIGAWIGWQQLPMLILISCTLVILFFILSSKFRQTQAFAFGAFLISGFTILIFI
jgi:leader peptidase (prepilin peptidase)/N-methyltransferase